MRFHRAAMQLGMDVADYVARRERGERWCWGCVEWHPASEFGRNRTRPGGYASSCRRYRRDTFRLNYQPKGATR